MSKLYFKDNLRRFFSLNKWLMFFITTVFILGFLTGVLCTLKANVTIDLSFIQNYALRNILQNKWSHLSFVLVQIILCILLIVLLYIISFFKFSKIVFTIIFVYLSYILGIDCCVIIQSLFAIKGVLYDCVLFLCCGTTLFLIMIFSYKISYYNKDYCSFGNSLIWDKEFEILLFFMLIVSIMSIAEGLAFYILDKIFVF